MEVRGWKSIGLHVLFVVFFLSIPILFSPDFDYTLRVFRVPPFQRSFAGYVLVVLFFYVHYLWILPRFYFRKLKLVYTLLVLVSFVSLILIHNTFFPDLRGPAPIEINFGPPAPRQPMPFMMDAASLFLPYVLALLVSLVLFLNRQAKKIEVDRMRTELVNLKYQLQPHFLFNSLNNIYSISVIHPERTPHYILELSEILRYLLLTEEVEQVQLVDDLKFCRQYVDLQRLRYGKQADDWELVFPDNLDEIAGQIAPFLLIPLIENVFKYGMHPDKKSPISIRIVLSKEGQLTMETWNLKNNGSRDNLLVSQKMGLKKTVERLKLLYPGKHQMKMTDEVEAYHLTLEITLK